MGLKAVSDLAASGGIVNSVTGTANQVTVSPTSGAAVVSLPSALIVPGNLTVTGGASAVAWGTSGKGIIQLAATYTDTSTGAGTLAAEYVNVYRAPDLAFTNAVTVTDAYNSYYVTPTAGANATLTAAWALGADNAKINGKVLANNFDSSGSTIPSNGFTQSAANVLSFYNGGVLAVSFGASQLATFAGVISGVSITQSPSDNSTKIATTAFVTAAVPAGATAPTFAAQAATNQTGMSGETKVVLGTELFDTNNNFATSRFTPTVAGYYQINGTLNVQDTVAITLSYVVLYKNGSAYLRGDVSVISSGANLVQSVSAIMFFNGSTDYAELFGVSNGTSPSWLGAGNANSSSMSGSFLHA